MTWVTRTERKGKYGDFVNYFPDLVLKKFNLSGS